MKEPQLRAVQTKVPGRQFRDLAVLLPCLGILLLITPVVSIFTQSGHFLGLPTPVFYIFGVWAGLIILAFGLARMASKADQE